MNPEVNPEGIAPPAFRRCSPVGEGSARCGESRENRTTVNPERIHASVCVPATVRVRARVRVRGRGMVGVRVGARVRVRVSVNPFGLRPCCPEVSHPQLRQPLRFTNPVNPCGSTTSTIPIS